MVLKGLPQFLVLISIAVCAPAYGQIYYSTAAAANVGSLPSVWHGDAMSSLGGGSTATFNFSGLRDVLTSTASAEAGPFSGNRVLKMQSSAQSFTAGPDSLVTSLAMAAYTDRVFLSNNANSGEPIRLLFELSGIASLGVSSGGSVASYGGAEVDLTWTGSFETLGDLYGTSGMVASAVVNLNSNDGLSYFGLSDFQAGVGPDSNGFRGRFSIDALFEQGTGSYGYSILGRAFTSVYNGSARMNVGNSVRLIAVYDSSNQVIPFSSLTFASGAILTAVPEPSSAVLLCLVSISLISRRSMRRT